MDVAGEILITEGGRVRTGREDEVLLLSRLLLCAILESYGKETLESARDQFLDLAEKQDGVCREVGGGFWMRLNARACHVWLWNSWKNWMTVSSGFERLVELDIWTNHPDILVPNDDATRLLQAEAEIVEANEKNKYELGSRVHLHAVTAAGENDEMSGVCQANISVALNFMAGRVGSSNKDETLSEAMAKIQEVLDEDDGNPRYYERLGHFYSRLDKEDEALKTWERAIALDHDHETCCREEYYQLKVYTLTRKDYGCTTPDHDAAIAVLKQAIKDDPENASSRWFHQMATMYKEKGDLEGARRTYRADMEFDPSWNSQWEDLADTYIDKELFEETRQFNWRGYCDALIEATILDPSRAYSHWDCTVSKANKLKEYQHFELAVEIFEYGIETSSQQKNKAAAKARANFEFALGETFCAMAKWEAAVSSLEDFFKHTKGEPERYKYNSLGAAYISTGRYEQSLAVYNKAVEEDPESSGKHASVGEIYLISGMPSKALTPYKTAIRLQEAFAVKSKGRRNNPTAFDQCVRDWYIDLGMTYERLERKEQALACYQKARHHAEELMGKLILGWLYERLDPRVKRVEDAYDEKAVWGFKTTVHAEDDFLEETECAGAEEALARVKRGEAWVLPSEEVERGLRDRARAMTFRNNWGVNLERRKKRTKQCMMRGH
ncbi:uncharacterized protein PAC_01112 [Phialocephala subalpina]|uniref:TPR-like protein n=1 Tax=Phialocephala subalpina TaxID=576137 RepID=A0A1L7WEM9_9HELO|nr:uncharacterized protein PAC_01112 [Phialocephala subalpina]